MSPLGCLLLFGTFHSQVTLPRYCGVCVVVVCTLVLLLFAAVIYIFYALVDLCLLCVTLPHSYKVVVFGSLYCLGYTV